MKETKRLIKELDEVQRKIEEFKSGLEFIICLGERFCIDNKEAEYYFTDEVIADLRLKQALKEEIKDLLDNI